MTAKVDLGDTEHYFSILGWVDFELLKKIDILYARIIKSDAFWRYLGIILAFLVRTRNYEGTIQFFHQCLDYDVYSYQKSRKAESMEETPKSGHAHFWVSREDQKAIFYFELTWSCWLCT